MARELILIPKMKYEQLINMHPREDNSTIENPTKDESDELNLTNTKDDNGTDQSKKVKHVTDDKTSDSKSYVEMQPKEFLKSKKRGTLKQAQKEIVKQKWLKFNL